MSYCNKFGYIKQRVTIKWDHNQLDSIVGFLCSSHAVTAEQESVVKIVRRLVLNKTYTF